MPELSIVIPCYNSGHFLPEAIDSIQCYKGTHSYEIIVVNDGSTEENTLLYLNTISQTDNCRVIHQSNAGPAAARNTGVRNAATDYVLFLDSDNRIHANAFIDSGIPVLNADPAIGVYYGNPSFFGDVIQDRIFKSGPFDLQTMWQENYIDMCSIVRKAAWHQVGGLDENRLLIGHEDWDFWLRTGRTGWKFHYDDAVLFDYRIVQHSLVTQSSSSADYDRMVCYLYRKHNDILPPHLKEWCSHVKAQAEH